MPNFQNGFSTNLTSNTLAGVTTTPLNDIPSISADFYLAFDATNANNHYEVVLVTSKTATNVNHAATSYAHTTDEEVRCITPAVHLNTMQNFPRGFLINGKIVPSVASNNLTVAIKGLDGNDPSVTNPVYIRIGDTVRSITAALSITANAGTNYQNAGSSELATKEIDFFVYLIKNGTDADVQIGFARIPYAQKGDDFSWAAYTNEKSIYHSGTSPTLSTDVVENIGRFAATLSAGAGYTWSVPTFATDNLIQRPIYETREATWVPTFTGFSVNPSGGTYYYKIIGDRIFLNQVDSTNGTSNATGFTITLPFSSKRAIIRNIICVVDNGTPASGRLELAASATATIYKDVAGNVFTNSGNKNCTIITNYQI
jgi:hypothetical protein